jgi:hypothetical protein
VINSDDLVKMQLTASQGLPIDLSGVEITEETADAFDAIKAELEQAPEGTMVEIPYEWSDPEAYADLIAASEKAHGVAKTLVQMEADKQANGETPITFG